MLPNIKNIIIFAGIGLSLVLVYVFFIKGDAEEESLVTTTSNTSLPGGTTSPIDAPAITQDFLSLLLNIKSIKLEDAIFADPAFQNLRDSTIVLIPDGNEGRPNPFAPIGSDTLPQSPN